MKITKAVITAAGPGQSRIPLQDVVDCNGEPKTALQLILNEAVDAGIQEICIVIRPGDASSYGKAAGEHANHLVFVEQDTPRGYGDALHRAERFVDNVPFLHLVGDHLYISQNSVGCAKQLVDFAEAESCAVSAVNPTRENQLALFGAIGGTRVAKRSGVYEITKVIEKPTPTQAEQELIVAGLRASHYLCMFGLHVLTPTVMELLGAEVASGQKTIQLTDALARLATKERYLASEIQGQRYNIGIKYGLLMAQLAIGLSGKDRDQILTQMLELVASKRDT